MGTGEREKGDDGVNNIGFGGRKQIDTGIIRERGRRGLEGERDEGQADITFQSLVITMILLSVRFDVTLKHMC